MDTQQTPIETSAPMAQPLPVTNQVVPILPSRRNKRLILVVIATFLLALILGLVALLLATVRTPSTNTTDQTPVSTPTTESTPNPEVTVPAKTTERINFNINTSKLGGSSDVNIEVDVPLNSQLIETNESHSIGYTIKNNNNEIKLYIPYESFSVQYKTLEAVGTNAQFGTVSRFQINGSDNYYYTDNTRLNGMCTSMYAEPCGEMFIGNANSDYIFASCSVSSKEYCDKMILTLSVKTTRTEPTTKDVSVNIDLNPWTTKKIAHIDLSNVPVDATATFETQAGGRLFGYRIKNDDFNLLVYYPYESFSNKFVKAEGSIQNEQFGEMKRVYFEGLETTSQYVSIKDIFNDCPYDTYNSEASDNCASQYLSEGTGENDESIYVKCESGFEICDEIMSTIKVSSTEE